ncbi:MAG: rod shape-determining protein MreC [Candidatus Wildermuthbacteria bacterium]|nr:rod shape-determining protein MreC [Candidatus Wildermuthbacteria bacterium]
MKAPKTIAPASLIASAIMLILALLLFGRPIRSSIYAASQKTQRTIWNASSAVSLFATSVPRALSILNEYKMLTQERSLIERMTFALEETERENDALREALALQKNTAFQRVIAEPIGREIAGNILLVNRGKLQGIKPGMPVITASFSLVGTVLETEGNVSRVMLLLHPNTAIDGVVAQKNISGVVKGEAPATLVFDLIPRDAPIAEGDVVVTNRFSSSIPHSLILGTVARIERNDAWPFAKASLRPSYGEGRIETPLFILRAISQ